MSIRDGRVHAPDARAGAIVEVRAHPRCECEGGRRSVRIHDARVGTSAMVEVRALRCCRGSRSLKRRMDTRQC